MNEPLFRKIIVALSIFGIIFLLFLITFFNPTKITISDVLSGKFDDKVISISGKLQNINYKNNIYFFNLCNFSICVPSVLFNPNNYQKEIIELYYKSKKEITITGKVTTYNSNNEVIVYDLENN